MLLRMHRAPVAPDTVERFTTLTASLPRSYRRVISPLLALQAETFGLDSERVTVSAGEQPPGSYVPSNRQQLKRAEILTDGSNTVILQLREITGRYQVVPGPDGEPRRVRSAEGHWLYVYCMTSAPLDKRLNRLLGSIERVFAAELTPFSLTSERFEELKSEGMEVSESPGAIELAAVQVLSDRETRTLATAIKQSGGLLVTDVGKQLPGTPSDRAENALTSLTAEGVIAGDVVVVCSRSQAQTARAPSREALHQLSAAGLRCACGREITDERIEEAVQVTDLGRSLLDSSRWFSLLLLQRFSQLGVPADRILIEQTSRGEEFDCLVDVGGRLVFFELKDKEFSLGNAYSFGAKIGIIRPDYPVIVTTDRVAGDVKEHFQRSEEGRRGRARYADDDDTHAVRYIEGLDDLESELGKLVTEIFGQRATRTLSETLPHALVGASSLVDALGGPSDKEEVLTKAPSSEPRKSPRKSTKSAKSPSTKKGG